MSMGLLADVDRGLGRTGIAPPPRHDVPRAWYCPIGPIRLCGAVTERDESTRTVEVDVWIESDEGERLVIGTATVRLA